MSHFPLPLHPFRLSSGDFQALPVDFGFKGGGSGSGGGPRLTRSQTQIPQRLRDFHLATGSGPRQSRIDTGMYRVNYYVLCILTMMVCKDYGCDDLYGL